MTDRERVLAFLDDLAKLTRKHGISIAGCGCCGSPWLDGCDLDVRDVGYDESKGKYTAFIEGKLYD